MTSLVKKNKRMKLYQLAISSLLIAGLASCGDSEEAEETSNNSVENLLDELDLEEQEAGWEIQTDREFCQMRIPNSMEEMPELNPLATIKYGSVEQSGDKVYENYVIVIPETYEEIEEYNFDFEFDLESYNEVCVDGMKDGLQSHEVLTKDSEIEEINGLDAILTELQGSIAVGEGQVVEIYYLMGVIKGDNAYYQVLSWTLKDQKSKFKKDMEKMIRSFKEI